MTQAIRITVTGTLASEVDNPLVNTWWYISDDDPAGDEISQADVDEVLDNFAVSPWEDALELINDSYTTVRMQGDVFDTELPSPFITDIFSIKTSFIQPNGLRTGEVLSRADVISFIRPRDTREVKAGGLRIGPLSKDDWLLNAPIDGSIDTLILQFTIASGQIVAGIDLNFESAIWSFPTISRPLTAIVRRGLALVFTKVTTQRSRLLG